MLGDQFLSISGECGFESYYVRERLEVMEPMNSPQSAEDTRDALKFKSNLEQVNNIFWRLKESNDTQGLEKLTAILENVILEHLVASIQFNRTRISQFNINDDYIL